MLLLAAGLSGSFIALAAGDGASSARSTSKSVQPVLKAASRPASRLAGFDPLVHREGAAGTDLEGKRVADLAGGAVAELTLVPELQAHVAKVLRDYQVPYGALVALEPKSGRVLAYVSHSSANPDAGDLARDPTPPAASVFKVITAAALLDAGVSPDATVCYSGGFRKIMLADLADDPKRDRACATLPQAMGDSINTVFAKLADRTLDRKTLDRYADAFGFGHALPFDASTKPSPGEVLADRLELARTAAGFWHMHMSPLHGALIAATLANGGAMPRASMVERVIDSRGTTVHQLKPSTYRQVIPRATAQAVSAMTERTVTHGTARSAFFDPKGRPFLPGIAVAGKTGSLSSERPFRHYTWWVGHAPADAPKIAVAALVVNTPEWRIKASYLAREALKQFLVQ
jgi:cell division protein FtsI/penicillin-binding protein 2